MALTEDRKELEDRLLASLIRLSCIEFGQLNLSVWNGQLYQAAPCNSRRPGDPPHKPFDRKLFVQDKHVRSAVAALCRLWECEYATIALKVKDGHLIHIDVHQALSDPLEARLLRERREVAP